MSQAGIIDFETAIPQMPTTFDTDFNSAVPVANVLEILGGAGITTSGSGNTVTIDLTGGSIAVDTFITDLNSPVVPDGSGNVTITGTHIFSDGSVANTITLDVDATANTFLYGQGDNVAMAELGPLTDGQLIIGSTGNAPVAGSLTSTDGSVTISTGAGTIDLAVAAADDAIMTLTGDDSEAISPTLGNIDIQGVVVANAANTKPVYIEGTAASSLLEIDIQVGAAITGAPVDSNDAGLSSYNDTQFTQDANGYVSLKGGTDLAAIQSIKPDDGVDVFPNGSGSVEFDGLTVANATNAKPVFFSNGGFNINQCEVQVGAAITGAPVDKNDAGLVSFDDTDFSVDANGYVTLAGAGAGQTITGDDSTALSPTAGNWNILGLSGSKTSGSGSTLTVKSPPYADQGVGTVTLNSGSFVTGAVTITLPASGGLADGDLVEIIACNGIVTIQTSGTQVIHIGNDSTSAGGSAVGSATGDVLCLRYQSSTDDFWATSVIGVWSLS